MVQPDRTIRPRNFIAQIHTPAKRPTDFELTNGPVLISHQAYSVIFSIDWVNLRIRPTGHFHRSNALTDKIACDLDAVTAHVHDRTAPGKFLRPEPVAMWAAMRLA